MPDALFADSRLADLYDALDTDRSDLDLYRALVAEFGSRSVLDIGCGTGTLACLLAAEVSRAVTGVDPAAASLTVARAKAGADRVTWLLGDGAALPATIRPMSIDLVVMTANVAQVFLTDEAWAETLDGIRRVLRPSGRLVFETRDPADEAWRRWNRAETLRTVDIDGVGPVTTWTDLLDVAGPLVTFRHTFEFAASGEVVRSESTLRFRDRSEIDGSLAAAGLRLDEVRDAPDRPGKELVVIAAPLPAGSR